MSDIRNSIAEFDATFPQAMTSDQMWMALHNLYVTTVEFKLFTITTMDIEQGLARRSFTSDPSAYPVSGTKPIQFDDWFDIVHRQHRLFVANTIADIAKVFPDHQKIWSLGCGSVVNVPIVVNANLVATVNILDVEHHYTPERVELIQSYLVQPALETYLRVEQLS